MKQDFLKTLGDKAWALNAVLVSLLVAGCVTATKEPTTSPAGQKRPGAYYMDDGPMDTEPPGIMEQPNATPRIEPLHKYANRPYTVRGHTYTPMTTFKPYKARGRASWYGKKFHNKNTSSGEKYDMFGMTAAHPTLPIPSYARVRNVANGNTVIVRINDRGPFLSKRIMDLSYAAAKKLGYMSSGSGDVEVTLILPDEIASGSYAKDLAATPAPANRNVSELKKPPAGFYVQVGAFAEHNHALAHAKKIMLEWPSVYEKTVVIEKGNVYSVSVGPFATRSQADTHLERIKGVGGKGFVFGAR